MLVQQLLAAVLSQADVAHQVVTAAPAMPWWWGAASGVSIFTAAAALWFLATYKRDLDRVKKIVTPDDADEHLGTKVKALAEKYAALEAGGKSRMEKLEHLEREVAERAWCNDRHETADRERRESVAAAHEAVRKLEARVIEAEKTTLQLGGDLKAAITGIDDLKKMLRQLTSTVAGLSQTVSNLSLGLRAGASVQRQPSTTPFVPDSGEDEGA